MGSNLYMIFSTKTNTDGENIYHIMEKKKISNIDVIVSRGIWYLVTVFSLFGLAQSLNLLWPPGEPSSRFHRDYAVSVTTFYAVTLLRYLLFTDPPSTCYREFSTHVEKVPQVLFSLFASSLPMGFPSVYELLTRRKYEFSMSLFAMSLATGGIGLVQLSNKFRMDMGHAFFTLFLAFLFCLFGIVDNLYNGVNQELVWLLLCILHGSFSFYAFVFYNFHDEDWKLLSL